MVCKVGSKIHLLCFQKKNYKNHQSKNEKENNLKLLKINLVH